MFYLLENSFYINSLEFCLFVFCFFASSQIHEYHFLHWFLIHKLFIPHAPALAIWELILLISLSEISIQVLKCLFVFNNFFLIPRKLLWSYMFLCPSLVSAISLRSLVSFAGEYHISTSGCSFFLQLGIITSRPSCHSKKICAHVHILQYSLYNHLYLQ